MLIVPPLLYGFLSTIHLNYLNIFFYLKVYLRKVQGKGFEPHFNIKKVF